MKTSRKYKDNPKLGQSVKLQGDKRVIYYNYDDADDDVNITILIFCHYLLLRN